MRFPSEMIRRLNEGQTVEDHEFDRIYPRSIRRHASVHWTPVSIARRAAQLLVLSDKSRILDVGSGAGKFCFVGAASVVGRFVGVERREGLVISARNIARQFDWPRVEFMHGDALAVDWRDYDGIYLFNPFAEHLFKSLQMDDQIEPGLEPFDAAVANTETKLTELRTGARVALLNGFGGMMPEAFRLEAEETCGNASLEIWVKQA